MGNITELPENELIRKSLFSCSRIESRLMLSERARSESTEIWGAFMESLKRESPGEVFFDKKTSFNCSVISTLRNLWSRSVNSVGTKDKSKSIAKAKKTSKNGENLLIKLTIVLKAAKIYFIKFCFTKKNGIGYIRFGTRLETSTCWKKRKFKPMRAAEIIIIQVRKIRDTKN